MDVAVRFVEQTFLLEEGQEPFLTGLVSILLNLAFFFPPWQCFGAECTMRARAAGSG